jgi:putative flippase GtrA
LDRKVSARLARFVGIGGLATAVHVAVALACRGLLGLPDLTANLGGVLTAMMVSYFGHLHVTFGVAPAHTTQVPRFLLTSTSALIVSSASVAVVTGAGGSFLLAMALVVVAVPAASYALFHLWVFNGRPESGTAPRNTPHS